MDLIESVILCDNTDPQTLHIAGGRIVSITPSARTVPPKWWVTPHFFNAHAHVNRAFTAPLRRPQSLDDAVRNARDAMRNTVSGQTESRARQFFEKSLRHGVTRIRTHTDVNTTLRLTAIHEILHAAEAYRPYLDVELVAFANAAANPADAHVRELLLEAVDAGASFIGAVPALYPDPAASLDAMLDLAATHGLALDLHLDEHLDVDVSLIPRLIDGVQARSLKNKVTVSHGCVLSAMPDTTRMATLESMAESGMTLVVLPELNLFLQDRAQGQSPRQRGLAPVLDALACGVNVRFGTDNVRDWFFPFGDCDMLATGYIGMLAAHLDQIGNILALICGGRHQLAVGDPADLVLIPATSADDAMARQPAERVVLKDGQPIEPARR